jgi:subtilase family serine protease
MSDIKAFTQCYFGTSHTSQVSVTSVDGGPGTGPGSAEAALDVEDVAALAPGAKIHVFQGPNMDDPFGPLDTWNAIAVADDASQISSSWGLCETEIQQGAPGVLQVENEIFQQTAAQGQTVFSSAGDDGSDDCAGHGPTAVATNLSLDDPASQPYVTSVGGTTITSATEPPKETVWNNGNNGGGGGGGISEAWAMQPWQDGVAVHQTTANQACSNDPSGTADNFHLAGIGTTLPGGTTCRETPDVSALADPQTGPTIFYAGFWTQIGGTSSSTPMWAAMLAEINGSAGCKTLAHGVGFADPLFYQVASSSAANYAQAFSDVTKGNNDNLGVGSGVDWPATKGYDLATGLGTPRLTDATGPRASPRRCAQRPSARRPLFPW